MTPSEPNAARLPVASLHSLANGAAGFSDINLRLPEGWQWVPLGAIAEFINGDRGANYPTQADRVVAGVPFINTGHIEANGRLTTSGMDYITRDAFERLRSGKVQVGDILYCLRGSTIGKTARNHYSEGAVASSLVVVRSNTHALQEYLYFYLTSPLGRQLVAQHDNGSAQPNLSVRVLGSYPVPLPPLDEQRAIARILGTLDDKIELNRRMNETLEAMARALFKSWFVDFDPVHAKAQGQTPPGMDPATAALFPSEFQDSELGEIPKGWTSLALYDAATYVNGAAYRAFQPNGDRRGLPIIKIAELKAGVTEQTKYSDVEMPEKYRLKTGDILFSWSGNPDTSIDTFVWSHGPAWLNQHIFRVDPHRPEERTFVLATLKYLRPVFAEIARNKQTTGLGHVTAGDMKRLLIVKPDARTLKAWNATANPIFDAVFRNTLEAQTLAKVRDGLLPRLLSGELSVARAEEAVEATA